MILIDQQGTKIQASIKKKLISDFENVMEEGTVRVMSDFAVGSNSGSYMLVNHPFKLNFYKTTKVKISDDFADNIDPDIFPSFGDLLMKNLDMRVAFDIVGLVVSVDPMHVTQEDGREKQKMMLQLQDLTGQKISCALWDSYAVKMNKYISENNSDSPVVIFLHMAKLKEWGDVFGKVRVVIRVQDSTGSSSFVLFGRLIQKLINRSEAWLMDKIAKDQVQQIVPEEINMLLNRRFVFKIQISMINLENEYPNYTVHKCTDDGSVIDDIFKRAHANEEGHVNDVSNVNDDETPSNKDNKLKHVDTTGDNMRVIDLDASTPATNGGKPTPATNGGKRPIVMVEESCEYDCSSSKATAPVESLKIPKMEKLD